MVPFILRRLAGIVPVMMVVVVLSFLLVELIPGDAATAIAGENATPEEIEALREQLGVNLPVVERFGDYVISVVTLQFGTSIHAGQGVLALIGKAIAPTLSLMLFAMVIAIVIAIPLGVASALGQRRLPDRITDVVTSLAMATPPFVVGLVLVILFAINNPILPATGYVSISQGAGEWLRHLLLPGIALAMVPLGEITKQVRGGMVDVLEQDFMRSVRAKGMGGANVILKHGLRNAGTPIVTAIGLQVSRLVAGAVVIEQVFAIPGLGYLAFNSVIRQDITVLRGIVIVSALLIALTNLTSDAACAWLNPRLRK